MKAKFPGGYRGRETGEQYVDPDTVFDLPDEAMHLVTVGLAVLVDEPEKPKTTRRAKKAEESADETK